MPLFCRRDSTSSPNCPHTEPFQTPYVQRTEGQCSLGTKKINQKSALRRSVFSTSACRCPPPHHLPVPAGRPRGCHGRPPTRRRPPTSYPTRCPSAARPRPCSLPTTSPPVPPSPAQTRPGWLVLPHGVGHLVWVGSRGHTGCSDRPGRRPFFTLPGANPQTHNTNLSPHLYIGACAKLSTSPHPELVLGDIPPPFLADWPCQIITRGPCPSLRSFCRKMFSCFLGGFPTKFSSQHFTKLCCSANLLSCSVQLKFHLLVVLFDKQSGL